MIKYRTRFDKIEKVEADKETEKFINIYGRRESKKSSWSNIHDSFEEAKSFLVANKIMEIGSMEEQILRKEKELEEIKQIQDI